MSLKLSVVTCKVMITQKKKPKWLAPYDFHIQKTCTCNLSCMNNPARGVVVSVAPQGMLESHSYDTMC